MTAPVAQVKRALIVALDNLGDLVFASALAPPLRAAFPGARIDIWCKSYTAPVARLVPEVDDVIHGDPFWAVPAHRVRPPIRPFLRSVAEVRRRRYDVAILSGAPWRTAAAVALAGVPTRIGLARHRNAAFLTHVLPAEDPRRPVVREQARLLGALGIAPHPSSPPRYRLDPSRLGVLRGDVARQLPPAFIALHPFAGARNRCVPLGVWTQVALALHARGLPALWIGTTPELEELRRSYTVPRGVYVDRLGDGSLAVTAAALSLARAFAGHDSGPLHIAAAFGVPVVGVFAPGQPDRTFPQGTGPWRMIQRSSPNEITAADVLGEIGALGSVPSLSSAP
jgi:ADP-heptose:LPS heptosyltransferase